MPNHDKRLRLASLSLATVGALSCFAAGQSLASNSTNSPSLNCVSVQVGQLQANDVNFDTSLGLSVQNSCGKDISEIGVNFGADRVGAWDWINMVVLAKDQPPENPILFNGTTKHLLISRDTIPADATWTPTVSFAVFMDRTAIGDATAISRFVIPGRQRSLAMFEEQKELLTSITASGQTISPETISSFLKANGETLQSPGRSYLVNLRENLGKVDPSLWPSTINEEQERTTALIALLKLHSQISIQAAATTGVTP